MATRQNFIHVANDSHFLEESKKISNKLIVLDFTAAWCGPCQLISPYFENISEQYQQVMFFKIDVDKCQGTALAYGVQSMPTFLFIWKEKQVDILRGANPPALENMVEKWASFAEKEQAKENITVGKEMECFSELLTNPREDFLTTSALLIRFADNVLKDERNTKYRSIRLENKVFQEKILPFAGAVQCLFEMGFQEEHDKLVLPLEFPLDKLRALRDALSDEREKINNENKPVDSFPPVAPSDPLRNFNPVIRTPNEHVFYQKLKSSATHVSFYEDPDMIRYCLAKIPLTKLTKEAKEQSQATTVDEKDCLLLRLLAWFKSEFFTWINQPNCVGCNTATNCTGTVSPSEDDRRWGAGNVEKYTCQNCNRGYTFPRYNHPQKLLETRTGRCGEWANCFSACCRAVGFDTRYVLDWTDHVWTEVYSEHQKRWLHCDPCENVCDKPLLYEAGWGKKLTYVIAFSKDEVIDVTWRYSQNHKEVLTRRNDVTENWLMNLWMGMSKELQAKNTKERNDELEKRRIVELVEFLTTKSVTDGERVGRQSGSMAWRVIRGEAGNNTNVTPHVDPVASKSKSNGYVFVPTVSELKEGRLKVRYYAARDVYIRGDELNLTESNSVNGWDNGTEEVDGLFRKIEHDWEMVYLARKPGVAHGNVSWKFKVGDESFAMNQIEVITSSTTFEDGMVEWSLENGSINEKIPGGGPFISTSFNGSSEIKLVAHLKGGKGDVAWQHAQLFRQKLDDINTCGFEIVISLQKK